MTSMKNIDKVGIYIKENREGLTTLNLLEFNHQQPKYSSTVFWNIIIAVNSDDISNNWNKTLMAPKFIYQLKREHYLLYGLLNSYEIGW